MISGAHRRRRSIAGTSVPRIAPHIDMRFDETRGKWIILAPERLFLPDEQALAILKKIDGTKSIDAIVDELVIAYRAPRHVIATDVMAMMQTLADKGVVDA